MKKKYMLWIVIIALFLGLILFVNFHPVFWGSANKYEKSENYKDRKFKNLVETKLQTWKKWFFWMIKDYIQNDEERYPGNIIPTKKFNKSDFKSWDIVWFWHSTILMNVDWKKIITDPVFYKASPIFIWWKSFKYSTVPEIKDLPDLDIVLISHDHYDHLDYNAIKEIDSKVWKYYVPLWVKSHLIKWWINSNKVKEFDWYNEQKDDDILFAFTPSRHFSGRGLTNRNSTLWWSRVIKSENVNLFFSWDTWYFEEFKKIWKKYGPFEYAFIENGAYNDSWSEIHMMPEDWVKAGLDLNANNVMPIHWWKFDLSLHSWYEPITRFSLEAEKKWLSYFHPQIWEIFNKENLPKNKWWEDLIQK